jgi:ABC-type polysaccharide/polyol phosphate export permease
MYLTPVVYAAPVFSGATKLLAYNPVSPILTYGRDCLLGVSSTVDLSLVGIISLASVLILIIGIVIQRIAIEILIERMGS